MGLINSVGNIFSGIGKIFDKFRTPEQKIIAKLEYRIEAAMSYIHCDEGIGQFKDFDSAKKAKYKLHYRKRVFDV